MEDRGSRSTISAKNISLVPKTSRATWVYMVVMFGHAGLDTGARSWWVQRGRFREALAQE